LRWGRQTPPPFCAMRLENEFEKLGLSSVEDDYTNTPKLTLTFILLYMLYFVSRDLPYDDRVASYRTALLKTIGEFSYYYRKARFGSAAQARPFGNFSFALNTQVLLEDKDKHSWFSWKRFEELFTGYRSKQK